jgi:lipopolysaccharide transport system ATP-binding protein
MQSVGGEGRTVIFVSHNLPALQNLCTRCILLNRGQVEADGNPEDVIQRYLACCPTTGGGTVSLVRHGGRTGDSIEAMKEVSILSPTGEPNPVICIHDDVMFRVEFELPQPVGDVTFGLVVKNQFGAPVFGVNNLVNPSGPLPRPIQKGTVEGTLRKLPLMPGHYTIDLYLGSRGRNFDIVEGATELVVEPRDVFGSGHLPPPSAGNILWPAEWAIHFRE